ncbi:MAG: hypothetical protein ACKOW3_08445 [Hyphomicrobium sp.]
MAQHRLKTFFLSMLLAVATLFSTLKSAEAHGRGGVGWGIAAGVATGIILSEAYRYPRYYAPPYYRGGGYYYRDYPFYAGGYPIYRKYYDRPFRDRYYNDNYYKRHFHHGYRRPYIGHHRHHH